MRRDSEGGCLEAIGEIILEIVLFGIGVGVLALFGMGIDSEKLDSELITLIGIAAIAVLCLMGYFCYRIFKKKRKKTEDKGMYRIGIDLGGTNIAAAVIGEDFKIVKKKSVPTGRDREPALIMDDMAELCRSLCSEVGVSLDKIEAVGIASPGIANHDEGRVEYSCNLPFRRFPICRELSSRLGIDNIHVENDANAAAWGEAVAGAARGTKNSVMITLGTGVGGGVIIDGKVFSGFNFAGAELGHMVIEVGGRPCGCGRRGCWEAYSSATALINMTREKLEECERSGRETLMSELVAKRGKISGRTAFEGMRAGDSAAREVVDMYLGYLQSGIINMINIFQPEVLSIGGGVSGEGQPLIDMMLEAIEREQYGADFIDRTKVCIAELGNDAGLIGAAFLGI